MGNLLAGLSPTFNNVFPHSHIPTFQREKPSRSKSPGLFDKKDQNFMLQNGQDIYASVKNSL